MLPRVPLDPSDIPSGWLPQPGAGGYTRFPWYYLVVDPSPSKGGFPAAAGTCFNSSGVVGNLVALPA